eukprot:jgi/Mesvir1/24348/Mv11025-RA.1
MYRHMPYPGCPCRLTPDVLVGRCPSPLDMCSAGSSVRVSMRIPPTPDPLFLCRAAAGVPCPCRWPPDHRRCDSTPFHATAAREHLLRVFSPLRTCLPPYV